MAGRRRKVSQVETATPEAAKLPEVAVKAEQSPPVPRVLRVTEGRAITSLRGILGPGAVVKPSDFDGGQATIDQLEKAGTVA